MIFQFLLLCLFTSIIESRPNGVAEEEYIQRFQKPVKRRKLAGSNYKHIEFSTGSKKERLAQCAYMTLVYGMPSFDFWKKDCYINADDTSSASLKRSFRYSYYELKKPVTLPAADRVFSEEPKKEYASCPIRKRVKRNLNRHCPPSLSEITDEIKNSNWDSLPPIDETNEDEAVDEAMYHMKDLEVLRANGQGCDISLTRGFSDGILVKKLHFSCGIEHCLTSVYFPDVAYVALLLGATFGEEWLSSNEASPCPPGWQILQLHEEVAMLLGIIKSDLHDESAQLVIRDKGHTILDASTKNLLVRSNLLYALTDPNWTGERYRSFYTNLGYLPLKKEDIPSFLNVHNDVDEEVINDACRNLRDMPIEKLLESLKGSPKFVPQIKRIITRYNLALVQSFEDFFLDIEEYVRQSERDVQNLSMFEYINFVQGKNPKHILAFFYILTNVSGGEVDAAVNYCGGDDSHKYMRKELNI